KVDDKLTIGFFSFTFRQLAILAVGGGLAYDVWRNLVVLPPSLRLGVVVLIALATLALTYVRIGGRRLDTYLSVRLMSTPIPTCYIWRAGDDPALVLSAPPPPKPRRKETEEEEEHEQDS